MRASELIKELQRVIDLFGGNDPYVVIQHPNDDHFNNRDVDRTKRGLIAGYIGDERVVFLNHAHTLLGKEMEDQIWERRVDLENEDDNNG